MDPFEKITDDIIHLLQLAGISAEKEKLEQAKDKVAKLQIQRNSL